VLAVASATPEDLLLPSPVPVQAPPAHPSSDAVAGLGEELRGVPLSGLVGAEEHRDVRGWQLGSELSWRSSGHSTS
jgi:hypothetical protein